MHLGENDVLLRKWRLPRPTISKKAVAFSGGIGTAIFSNRCQ
jgi:hypothetical protein